MQANTLYPGSRIAERAPDMHFAPSYRPRQAEPNTPKQAMPPASAGWPVAWNCMGCMGYIAWPAWPDFCCCQKTQKTQNLTKTHRNANPTRVCSAKRHWYQCTSRRPAIARGSFAPWSSSSTRVSAAGLSDSKRGSAGAGVTQDHKNTRDMDTRHDDEARRPHESLDS